MKPARPAYPFVAIGHQPRMILCYDLADPFRPGLSRPRPGFPTGLCVLVHAEYYRYTPQADPNSHCKTPGIGSRMRSFRAESDAIVVGDDAMAGCREYRRIDWSYHYRRSRSNSKFRTRKLARSVNVPSCAEDDEVDIVAKIWYIMIVHFGENAGHSAGTNVESEKSSEAPLIQM